MIYLVGVLSFMFGALLAFFWRGNKISELTALLSSERSSKESIMGEFRLTAADALRQTAEKLIADGLRDIHQVRQNTKEDIENKKELIENSVKEMKDHLDKYQEKVSRFETERHELYGSLKDSIGTVVNTGQLMRMETAALKKALTTSVGVQGNLGQMQLEYILERANLKYRKQVTLAAEEGSSLRPDIIIDLPGDKELVVDSKAPIQEFLLADHCEDIEEQKEHYKKLAANIRDHVSKLSKKEYQRLVDSDIRFVLMFVPEGALSTALSNDPTLLQDAQDKNVLLTSPMTIIPLIQLISYSWEQYRLAEDAKYLGAEVETLGRYLLTFWEHLLSVQYGLKNANDGWNKAVASWKSRMIPQLEKVKKVSGKLKDLPEPAELSQELAESPD